MLLDYYFVLTIFASKQEFCPIEAFIKVFCAGNIDICVESLCFMKEPW